MKVSSLKFFLISLGLVACIAMTSGCNKGYGCPSDFHAATNSETPTLTIPSC